MCSFVLSMLCDSSSSYSCEYITEFRVCRMKFLWQQINYFSFCSFFLYHANKKGPKSTGKWTFIGVIWELFMKHSLNLICALNSNSISHVINFTGGRALGHRRANWVPRWGQSEINQLLGERHRWAKYFFQIFSRGGKFKKFIFQKLLKILKIY